MINWQLSAIRNAVASVCCTRMQDTFFLGFVKNMSEELKVQYMMTRGMLK